MSPWKSVLLYRLTKIVDSKGVGKKLSHKDAEIFPLNIRPYGRLLEQNFGFGPAKAIVFVKKVGMLFIYHVC